MDDAIQNTAFIKVDIHKIFTNKKPIIHKGPIQSLKPYDIIYLIYFIQYNLPKRGNHGN